MGSKLTLMLSSHLPSWINNTSAQNLVTHFIRFGDFAVIGFEFFLLTVIAMEGASLQMPTEKGGKRSKNQEMLKLKYRPSFLGPINRWC